MLLGRDMCEEQLDHPKAATHQLRLWGVMQSYA